MPGPPTPNMFDGHLSPNHQVAMSPPRASSLGRDVVSRASPTGSPIAARDGDRDAYFSQLLERNCSVGKGRRADGGGVPGDPNAVYGWLASAIDERVERCGGGKEPFLIGVAGGTASGKTTVCDLIMHNLQEKRVVLIAQD